ncbi:MAG TPA: hypothetical protein VMV69_20815 [Pirellulales bacterium]|nr:hypothetical protein [Pirellulales bacterium]
MNPTQWMTVMGLTLFLVEGFTLSVFPRQFKEFLAEADPRVLQIAGLFETTVAAGLMAGIVLG